MKKKIIFIFLSLILIMVAFALWLYFGAYTTNPNNYKTIGDVKTPYGYSRIPAQSNDFVSYIRTIPLKEKGTKIHLYTGGEANLQNLGYAVLDLPLLSNSEQCADCCIRLRAEHLYATHQYSRIAFSDVNGVKQKYTGGNSRPAFEKYLKRVYGVASTYSLRQEMNNRKLSEIQPGDVFVYAAIDRPGNKYGHAVMVADVAENEDGERVFLLVEGNTPARDMHLMRNWRNLWFSPWFYVDEDAETFRLSAFKFKSNELKYWGE